MSKHRIAICVALWLLASAAPALADTVINFASYGGNGVTFNKASGADSVNFSNLYVSAMGDSANNAQLTISNGGSFLLNSVSSDGLTGYFASNQNSGTITVGNASSGILTGSIQLVEIDTTTNGLHPKGYGAFTITLTLTGMAFSGCTTQNCTNSALLQAFAAPNAAQYSTDTLSFSIAGTQNASTLLAMNGTHATTVQGSLDSYVDTLTPEPASLALFGSGFLLAGMRLRAKFKPA
jgi:hypothetical protein